MTVSGSVVSVITVCLNCRDTIEKTIDSVIHQDYPGIEFIIIDGGSTDGSLDVINKYRDGVSLIISEKDSGIYDAMNKGLLHATGDIIYFLNSGDHLYAPGTVKKIVAAFDENPGVSLVCGDIVEYGETPDTLCSMDGSPLIRYFSHTLCHQALFARKNVFETVGDFNLQFRIFADRDWLFRCIFLNNERIIHVPIPVCYYLSGGFSSSHTLFFYQERIRLYLKYLGKMKIVSLLIRNPKELFLMSGMLSFSLMNVIMLSISKRNNS